MSILTNGVSGLNAAQAGLLTTGHNISNAATPGFNRQQIVQTTNTPQFTGAGFLGQGTRVETVRRIYSEFLSGQVLATQTRQAELEVYASEIGQIDSLLADPSAGLSPALQDLFKGVQEVAANPASLPARQAMLSAAQALVGRFHSLDQRLSEIRDGLNAQISGTVEEINAYARQIAGFNEKVVLAQASGSSQPPNDLLDQRDQLVAELNKLVRVTTNPESDGSLSVFIGSGQPLVISNQPFKLAALPATDDATRIEVALTAPGGGTIRLPETLLSGGKLGGLLAFRSQSLDPAQNALGCIAMGLASTFNAQHVLGQDLTGNLGGNFFVPPAAPLVMASGANGGAAVLGATLADATALTTSDYRLSFSGGNYVLTRLNDNTNTNLGAFAAPVTIDGITFANSGGLAAEGDSFLIQPTRSGARNIALAINDARGIAAAAPLRTVAPLSNTGTASIGAGSISSSAGLPLAASPGGDIRLQFDAANNLFNIIGGPGGTLAYDPLTESAGKTYTLPAVGGFTFTIAGVPANGDSFIIQKNAAGVADNRNALALGGLQTRNLLASGSASYQSAYSQLVSEAGNQAREANIMLSAQDNLAAQAQRAQQALSGVNLDEEAANLLRYQQAYQAAGKLIEISARLFDELLSLGR